LHYLTLFYILIFLVLVIVFQNRYEKKKKIILLAILSLLSVVYIGAVIYLQPIQGDPYRYNLYFHKICDLDFAELNTYSKGEYIYRLLNWLVCQLVSDFRIFILILFILFFFGIYKAYSILYPDKEKYLIIISIVLYPYILAYVESAKRQGIALVLMLLSIAYIFRGSKYLWVVFLFLIPFIHSGSSIVIPVVILFYLLKNKRSFFKIALTIYIITLLMAFLNLNKYLVDFLTQYINFDTEFQQYFVQNGEFARIHYKTGFRLDFTLFSLFPLILYLIFKTNSLRVKMWLGLYLLLNSLYNILCVIPFSDRVAVFSWFIWPIINYEILRAYNRKYAYVFLLLLFLSGIVLLQFYTNKYLLPLDLY